LDGKENSEFESNENLVKKDKIDFTSEIVGIIAPRNLMS